MPTALKLQTFDDPFYDITVSLDGQSYVFDFRFNQREACWYFSVALPDGTPLIVGIKVVCKVDFLSRAADVRLPQGTLMARSNSDDDSPPDLEELGVDRRVTLVYLSGV